MQFRAKQRFSDFCKQSPLNEQKDFMCNKAYTPKFYKIIRIFISCFMHMILFMYSLWNSHLINYSMHSVFSFEPFSECLKRWEIALLERDLVCSMITISENVAPKNLHVERNSQCNCEKQEYQVFHSITISELQHQHVQCECWSITKERHFQANVKHLTLHLWFGGIHVKLKIIPNFCKSSNLSKSQEQLYSQEMQNISVYVYKYFKREKRIGHMSVHWKWKLLNEYRILKPSSDKLINQTSYKYVRGVIYLVPLINIRYQ